MEIQPRGPFERPPTAVEAVLAEIRRDLLEGAYPPGSRLNADSISKQLGVSRAPVRDALRILEGERQVAYAAHSGYHVPEMSLADLFDNYRLRELLETEACTLAVPTLTEEKIDALRESATDILTALEGADRVSATHANRRFHFMLLLAPGHDHLLDWITQAWNADGYRALYLHDLTTSRHLAEQHLDMVEAAAAGDVARVVELQNQHRDDELAALLPVIAEHVGIDVSAADGAWKATTRPR